MKTLVIHPQDKSTDFLKPIYSNLEGITVITGGMTRADVDQEIIKHDRIMMMGHGSPGGLFAVGQFTDNPGFIISHGTADILRDKECIFIWCNADRFVEANELKGLYSGMFISEVVEANYCNVHNISQDVVDESNNYFAKELGSVSNKSLDEMYQHIKYTYGILTENNAVAEYNHERLYLNS